MIYQLLAIIFALCAFKPAWAMDSNQASPFQGFPGQGALPGAAVGIQPNQAELNAKLIEAAGSGNKLQVEQLIADGADVNAKTNKGETALMRAAIYRDSTTHQGLENTSITICELLIAHGADVAIKNKEGETALLKAAWRGKTKVCEILLDAGAYVDVRDKYMNTPLLIAVGEKHAEVCKMLLKRGADQYLKNGQLNPYAFGKGGNIALTAAAERGWAHDPICLLLIEHQKSLLKNTFAFLCCLKYSENPRYNLLYRCRQAIRPYLEYRKVNDLLIARNIDGKCAYDERQLAWLKPNYENQKDSK